MSDYHESWDALPAEARDLHRALVSLKEEVEAVDWYHQRLVMAGDAGLREILSHNRREEVEHACMMIEWLRRNMDDWDEHLRTYLFTEAPITEAEQAETGTEAGAGSGPPTGGADTGLGIGKLEGGR
jgi:uncharacterized protein